MINVTGIGLTRFRSGSHFPSEHPGIPERQGGRKTTIPVSSLQVKRKTHQVLRLPLRSYEAKRDVASLHRHHLGKPFYPRGRPMMGAKGFCPRGRPTMEQTGVRGTCRFDLAVHSASTSVANVWSRFHIRCGFTVWKTSEHGGLLSRSSTVMSCFITE